ncbi:hypothetical protein T492DRAFT_298615 [Pavlovales sp. CCMP2436]|nr:hypothetical protein T492DRAFT_298615 [Pavlovales sp. CCMP2436]
MALQVCYCLDPFVCIPPPPYPSMLAHTHTHTQTFYIHVAFVFIPLRNGRASAGITGVLLSTP